MPENIAFIVPTLQSRPEMLDRCLQSLLATSCQIYVISDSPRRLRGGSFESTRVSWLSFQGSLTESINFAVSRLPEDITHFNWIGDDDYLLSEAWEKSAKDIENYDLIVGGCALISSHTNDNRKTIPKSWRLSKFSMTLWASPIGQPAVLMGKSFFKSLGGLDTSLRLAFDQEIFTRFIFSGARVKITSEVTAVYSIHETTLSEENWVDSLREAAQVRERFGSKLMSPIRLATEWIRLWVVRILRNLQKS